jgi:hypothetical protein
MMHQDAFRGHGGAVLARGPAADADSDGATKAKTIGYW